MSSSLLVIKVTYDGVTRKLPLRNEDITYDEFLIMMQRVFKNSISSTDDITIKYMDEEDDLITVNDTDDLQFAMSSMNTPCVKFFIEHVTPVHHSISGDSLQSLQDSFSALQASLNAFSKKIESVVRIVRNEEKGLSKSPTPEAILSKKEILSDFDPIQSQISAQNSSAQRSQTEQQNTSVSEHLQQQPPPQTPIESHSPQRFIVPPQQFNSNPPQMSQSNVRMGPPPVLNQNQQPLPQHNQDPSYQPPYYRQPEPTTQLSQISAVDNPSSAGPRRMYPPSQPQGNWQGYQPDAGHPIPQNPNSPPTGNLPPRPPYGPNVRQPYAPPQGMSGPPIYRPGPPPPNIGYPQPPQGNMAPQYMRYTPPPQGNQQPPQQ